MKLFSSKQLNWIVFAIALMLLGGAGHAQSCGPESCVGPCTSQEILNDPTFIYGCPDWVLGGNASRVYAGAGLGYYISMIGGSDLYQNVTPPSGYAGPHEVGITITIIAGESPGTEHVMLRVVRQSDGAILENIATFFPSSSSGFYSYNIGNYTGQAVRIEAIINTSPHNGDTEFQISGLRWWETH
jgi:hypothetical protein